MASAAQQSQFPIAIATPNGVCDLSKSSYFANTIAGAVTFTFVNRPVDMMIFEVEIYLAAGTITWPSNVRWVGGLAPQNIQTGKYHIFQFRRVQSSGAPDNWLGSYLTNF